LPPALPPVAPQEFVVPSENEGNAASQNVELNAKLNAIMRTTGFQSASNAVTEASNRFSRPLRGEIKPENIQSELEGMLNASAEEAQAAPVAPTVIRQVLPVESNTKPTVSIGRKAFVKANNNVTKYFSGTKKTIGIRVPDNAIAQTIIKEIGIPLVVTTIHHDDQILEYMTNPEEIHEKFEHLVDCVIDGGAGGNIPSTIVDCSEDNVNIIRQGKGQLNS
jgi:hypothetical protein